MSNPRINHGAGRFKPRGARWGGLFHAFCDQERVGDGDLGGLESRVLLTLALKRARPVVDNRSRGVVSLLFAVIVLPLVLLMLTITFELSHFFGMRDELQKVVDREAHELASRELDPDLNRAQARLEGAVRARMANITQPDAGANGSMPGVVGEPDVAVELSPAGDPGPRSLAVRASAPFQGIFYRLAQRLFGTAESDLDIAARAQVRRQRARAVVVLDRRAAATIGFAPPRFRSRCTDLDYPNVRNFMAGLSSMWSRAGFVVTTAVAPGLRLEPVGLVSTARLSSVPCVNGSFVRSTDFAAGVAQLVAGSLLDPDLDIEARSVVLLLRRDQYQAGFARETYDMLWRLLNGTNIPLDLITVVLDTRTFDYTPTLSGINGGIHREVGALGTEFRGVTGHLLRSVVTRTLSDRIVLEQ
jgi:hypothetical protein